MSTLRIVLNQTLGPVQVRNIYHVAGAYAIVSNAQAIVDYFRSAYGTGSPSLVSQLDTAWSLDNATIKDVADVENPTIPVNFTAGQLVGTASGSEYLPTQIALLLSFSAVTAPPNRSRKYLAGWTEGNHDEDGWSSNAISAVTNYANNLLNMSSNLDSGIAMVVSRFSETGVLVGSNILDGFSISSYARTQRRRTPGRGI